MTNEQSIKGLADPADLIWNATIEQKADIQSPNLILSCRLAEMKAVGGKPIRFNRSYSLSPGSYVIEMSVGVENIADQPQDLAYRLEGANGITLEGWWYSNKISPEFLLRCGRTRCGLQILLLTAIN